MATTSLRLISQSVAAAKGSVYHYTGPEALLAMLEHRTLRASEASGMNDLAEVQQGWTLISELLASLPQDDVVDMLVRYATSSHEEPYEVFILCAASMGDDANQWRLYGVQGRGYAVELDTSIDLGVVSGSDHWPYLPTARVTAAFTTDVTHVGVWLPVMYDPGKVERALLELASSVRVERQAITVATGDSEDVERRWDGLKIDAYVALSAIAHLVKSPGFSGEREVRLVSTFAELGDHVHFRAGAYGIVGYINLATLPAGHTSFRVIRKPAVTSDLETLPIRSIRLGPLASPEQISTLRLLLDRNDLPGVDIERSSVPLR